jgi:hypothetical protein
MNKRIYIAIFLAGNMKVHGMMQDTSVDLIETRNLTGHLYTNLEDQRILELQAQGLSINEITHKIQGSTSRHVRRHLSQLNTIYDIILPNEEYTQNNSGSSLLCYPFDKEVDSH